MLYLQSWVEELPVVGSLVALDFDIHCLFSECPCDILLRDLTYAFEVQEDFDFLAFLIPGVLCDAQEYSFVLI